MRASMYPLVDAAAAAALVLEHTPVLGVEQRPLDSCAGRVLAEDVVAPSALPAFRSSAVDGFALRSTDAGQTLQVIGESAAGRPYEGSVGPGTAARILTGGALPEGADCVVMVEDISLDGDMVTVPSHLRAGTNYHNIGDDVRGGDRAGAAARAAAAAGGLDVHR